MKKTVFLAMLLLAVFLLPASDPIRSETLNVNGFYYGDDTQGDNLSFRVNQIELVSMDDGDWSTHSAPGISISENEEIPENGYVYDVCTWSLAGKYTGTLKIKFTVWALEASFTRGNTTYYTIPSHHEYLIYPSLGNTMTIVNNKAESTLNQAGNNLKGFADSQKVLESTTAYVSGKSESTLISKGYLKYITYTGTYDGLVDESGTLRLRITRVNAIAGLTTYHGTVRVEITAGV